MFGEFEFGERVYLDPKWPEYKYNILTEMYIPAPVIDNTRLLDLYRTTEFAVPKIYFGAERDGVVIRIVEFYCKPIEIDVGRTLDMIRGGEITVTPPTITNSISQHMGRVADIELELGFAPSRALKSIRDGDIYIERLSLDAERIKGLYRYVEVAAEPVMIHVDALFKGAEFFEQPLVIRFFRGHNDKVMFYIKDEIVNVKFI